MRSILGGMILALLSAAAGAQPIPDQDLKEHYAECTRTCGATRPYRFCSLICACMTNEIGGSWTAEAWRQATGRLVENPRDPEIVGELGRAAMACAARFE